MMNYVAAREVVSMFTSLMQTARAEFLCLVQTTELLCGDRILPQGRWTRNRQIVTERRRRAFALEFLYHFQEPLARRDELTARQRDHCSDPNPLCLRCRVPGLARQLEKTPYVLISARKIAPYEGTAGAAPQ